jgi:hypothetical protein
MGNSVEDRLARLEAKEDVRALKMRYARLCDAGYPAKELGELFVEDAVWDSGDVFGVYRGRKAIEEFFAATRARVPWALHYTVAGDIHLAPDARSATGSWFLWQPLTFESRALWLMATYADEYVLTDEGWRYANLRLDVQALTPVDSTWVEQQIFSA